MPPFQYTGRAESRSRNASGSSSSISPSSMSSASAQSPLGSSSSLCDDEEPPLAQLLESVTASQNQLRDEISRHLRSKHVDLRNSVCSAFVSSFSQLNEYLDEVKSALPSLKLPVVECVMATTARRPAPHQRPRNAHPTCGADAQIVDETFDSSLRALYRQFVNWQQILRRSLVDEIDAYCERLGGELKWLAVQRYAAFEQQLLEVRDDVRQMHAVASFCQSTLEQLGANPVPATAAYTRAPATRSSSAAAAGEPTAARPQPADEMRPAADRATDAVGGDESTASRSASAAADVDDEPNVAVISVATAAPAWSECGRPVGDAGADETTESAALATAAETLNRMTTAALAPTKSAPRQVYENASHARENAEAGVERLWHSINAQPVCLMRLRRARHYVGALVALTLVAGDTSVFYEHALCCALQLRQPANDKALAVMNVPLKIPKTARYAINVDFQRYVATFEEHLTSMQPEEFAFYEQVSRMADETLVRWGPAFACLLLQIGDRGADYVCRRLRRLNGELRLAFDFAEEVALPRIPTGCRSFVDRLKRYERHEVNVVRRNTLYKGLIKRYECDNRPMPARSRRFLNFLLLTSLRYRGMALLTLVDEFKRLYDGVSVDALRSNTSWPETKHSWLAYDRFTSTVACGRSKLWKYCNAFAPQTFSALSFDANYHLCCLLCALIDIRKLKNGRRDEQPPTILYHRLVGKTRQVGRNHQFSMTNVWKRNTRRVVRKFTNMSYRPRATK